MMADRKRLVALVLAQCAAFGAVLILAAFSGSGHLTTNPGSPSSSSPPPSPPPSSSAPPGVRFTVSAASPSKEFHKAPVVTYDAGTMAKVASASLPLGPDNSQTETVPAQDHGYLVCLSPPPGWKPTGSTFQFQGLTCLYLPLVTGDSVSFTFRAASSPNAGGTS